MFSVYVYILLLKLKPIIVVYFCSLEIIITDHTKHFSIHTLLVSTFDENFNYSVNNLVECKS